MGCNTSQEQPAPVNADETTGKTEDTTNTATNEVSESNEPIVDAVESTVNGDDKDANDIKPVENGIDEFMEFDEGKSRKSYCFCLH